MAVDPLRVWTVLPTGLAMDDHAQRVGVVPIVRAHLDRRRTEDERAARYGSLLTHYRLVDDPAEAEVAVLAETVERAGPEHLREVVATAEARGLRTLVAAAHDVEPRMPSSSIVLLHPGPTRGAQPHADVLAVPYLFVDRARGAPPRPDAERPSIAFCGQGATRPGAGVVQAVARIGRATVNRVRPAVVAPPVRSPVTLRARALRALRASPAVDDRFVIRDRYRAGAADEAERTRTQQEFDANLRSATYALCVRGTGNFSARFYEALSAGRVPLFVDTDCTLPFEDDIDWSARMVRVDRRDVGTVAERLVAAHPDVVGDPARSPDALRALWEDRLSEQGFYRHLVPALRRML